MLSTIITDVYEESEKGQILDALNEICSPNDTYGWSSAGLYSFWDYETKEILYLGSANNLPNEIKLQNGQIDNPFAYLSLSGKIDNYFRKKQKLGISLLLQSPLEVPEQVNYTSTGIKFNQLVNIPNKPITIPSLQPIVVHEKSLLQMAKGISGKVPVWNKKKNTEQTMVTEFKTKKEVIETMVTNDSNFLVAQSTLREIARNPVLVRYESFLHMLRIFVPLLGLKKTIASIKWFDAIGTFNEIMSKGYLYKKLDL